MTQYVVSAPCVVLPVQAIGSGPVRREFYQGAVLPDGVDEAALKRHLRKGMIEEFEPLDVEGVEDPGPANDPGAPVALPNKSASKADWVAYATSDEGGMAQAEAEAMTRDELAEKYLS